MSLPRRWPGAWLLVGLLVLVGAAWTCVGLGKVALSGSPGFAWGGIVASIPLSAVWIGVRFFRWQFLLRRADARVPTRDSLAAYLEGLLGLATPFMAGEVLRGAGLGARRGLAARRVVDALITERLLDVAALATFALVAGLDPGWFVAGLLVVGALALVAALVPASLPCMGRLLRGPDLGWASLATALVWLAPFLAIRFVTGPVEAVDVVGGLLRLFVTGGVPSAGVPWSGQTPVPVAVLFVAAPALIGAWRTVRPLRSRGKEHAAEHFDDIAEVYLDQWSPHVWSHLLDRKVALMASRLEPSMRGLDLGCGAGQQVTEMRSRGFDVIGIDPSVELVRRAAAGGAPAAVGDGLALPFANGQFDFVYAVGVLHHLPGPREQRAAVAEVHRVLRPGGLLLVHESNPVNPLFRFYMGYVFPLLKEIDEGIEWWLAPDRWRDAPGFELENLDYFTFIPDFLPSSAMRPFLALERWLERGWTGPYAVHYLATVRRREGS